MMHHKRDVYVWAQICSPYWVIVRLSIGDLDEPFSAVLSRNWSNIARRSMTEQGCTLIILCRTGRLSRNPTTGSKDLVTGGQICV